MHAEPTLEQLDTQLVGQLLGILVDGNVEAQHTSQLFCLLQHGRGLDDVSLVDGSDVDGRDWDFGNFEEIEQRFE